MHRRTFVTATLAALATPGMVLAQPAQTPATEAPPAASGVAAPVRPPLITPENALERSFLAALDNEQARPAFRHQLLTSQVALAISSTTPDAPPRQIELGQGAHACLIFTSSARATAVMGAAAPRVLMTGREALERVRGTNVIININLTPMLVLHPDDIEDYLRVPAPSAPATPAPVTPPASAGPSQ